uniref:Choline transporter-like protein n=1 Tax=Ditylenchus dipsaci TaxID=166011 RepID=A0A915EWE2_9BILA
MFADAYSNLFVYLTVCVASIVISFAISFAVIWKNKKTVYVLYVLSLPLGIGISIALIFSSIYNYAKSFSLESAELGLEPNSERFLNGNRVDYTLLAVLAVIVTVFTLIAWTITWTIIKPRSHLVTELFLQIREPIKCILWLLPEAFLNFLLSASFLALWVWILVNLLSAVDRDISFLSIWKRASMTQESAIAVHRTKSPTWLRYALMFHVFAFFWINTFLADVQKFVVAYAATTWYFNTNESRSWSAVYLKAVLFFWRYHLGSLAIGSLLSMLFRVPSHICLFLNHRVKQSRNNVVVGAYRRLSFCLKDVERFMKSIHVNAYAVVATNGEDFLSASNTAANLWQDNLWYMLTTNTVAALLFALTKVHLQYLLGFLVVATFGPEVIKFQLQKFFEPINNYGKAIRENYLIQPQNRPCEVPVKDAIALIQKRFIPPILTWLTMLCWFWRLVSRTAAKNSIQRWPPKSFWTTSKIGDCQCSREGQGEVLELIQCWASAFRTNLNTSW